MPFCDQSGKFRKYNRHRQSLNASCVSLNDLNDFNWPTQSRAYVLYKAWSCRFLIVLTEQTSVMKAVHGVVAALCVLLVAVVAADPLAPKLSVKKITSLPGPKYKIII